MEFKLFERKLCIIVFLFMVFKNFGLFSVILFINYFFNPVILLSFYESCQIKTFEILVYILLVTISI